MASALPGSAALSPVSVSPAQAARPAPIRRAAAPVAMPRTRVRFLIAVSFRFFGVGSWGGWISKVGSPLLLDASRAQPRLPEPLQQEERDHDRDDREKSTGDHQVEDRIG